MEKILFPKKIQIFFDEIIYDIKISLDPEYILIGGSFGKGSWIYSNEELLSDFEFVFIRKKRWSIRKKKDLLIKLNSKYPYQIHLKGYLIDKITKKIISNYSSRYPGYVSLDFFDAFFEPVVLYSRDNLPLKVDLSTKEIPHWELWRLCVNRIADLLTLEFNIKKSNKIEYDYSWLKVFESLVDAYLIIRNIYKPDINKRFLAFVEDIKITKNSFCDICRESFPWISKALEARRKHKLDIFNIDFMPLDKKLIVYEWLNYLEKILLKNENIIQNHKYFWESYLSDFSIQSKYLEINGKFAVLFSNLIRLLNHRELFNPYFKFYNFRDSWRHIILLAVSTLYKEIIAQKKDFLRTKKVLSKIVREKKLNSLADEELFLLVIMMWKKLR